MSFCINVKASTCSDERILELSSLANNVKVNYEPYDILGEKYVDDMNNIETQSVTPAFYITIYNLDEKLNVSISVSTTN